MKSFRDWSRAGICLLALGLACPAWADPEPVTLPAARRSVEQTFLTYPEWFLVYSPTEYADYVRDHLPTRFPFLGHIGQFWGGYDAVYRATKRDYPFNAGYHVMILVIGTSTTIEYAAKAVYQTLIGRLSDLTQSHGITEEDRFDARVAQDYVDFIRLYPWYEYDFARQLVRLWKETGLTGPDMIRKWERKYALTSEYGIKALYGWLIKKADRTVYEEEPLTTDVVLGSLPPAVGAELPQLKVERTLADGSVEASVPRYDAFMGYASTLADHGVRFREIAGNNSLILVTILDTPDKSPANATYRLLFTQPILTRPPLRREALVIPVAALSDFLRQIGGQGITLEHIYDY